MPRQHPPEDAHTHGRRDSLEARIRAEIDLQKLERGLYKECEMFLERSREKLAGREAVPGADPRSIVANALARFRSVYSTPEGQPDRGALRALAEQLIANVEAIPIAELVATATRLVDESPDEEILLFMREEDHRGAEDKMNSNVFMARLVERIARERGRRTRIITDHTALPRGRTINLIDDAAYTGDQMGTTVSRYLARQPADMLRARTGGRCTVRIYMARATEIGRESISMQARKNRSIAFSPEKDFRVGRMTPSVRQVLEAAHPDAYAYFYALPLISSLDHKPQDYRGAIAHAETSVDEHTLTVSEVRIPDFRSFPNVIAEAFSRKQRSATYPDVMSVALPD